MSLDMLQGKDLVLEYASDGTGTAYDKVIAGVQTRTNPVNNPTTDTTNQASTGLFAENAFNGYKTTSISGSGVCDKRVGAALESFYLLAEIAASADPTAFLRLADDPSSPAYEAKGRWIMDTFTITSEQQGIATFDFSLTPCDSIEVNVTKPTFP